MRRGGEECVVGAKAGGKRSILVELARFDIEFLEIIRIEDMQLIGRYSDDGS